MLELGSVTLAYMAGKPQKDGPAPTEMGRRILAFMTANNVSNRAQFAEGVLGISRQRFHAWLFRPIEAVEAKPLLVCAEALGTNAEYLLGVSDDPRPEYALDYREAQLVDAYRVLSDKDKERLLKNAADWVGETEGPRSVGAPFNRPPRIMEER